MPREIPLEWVLARDDTYDVSDEVESVFQGVPEWEREMRQEEMFDTLDLARMGKLPPDDDEVLVPVRRDPLVFELRFAFTEGVYRIYFGEPEAFPDILVGLHIHLKKTDGTDAENKADQDAHMDLASRRLQEGEPSYWGNLR